MRKLFVAAFAFGLAATAWGQTATPTDTPVPPTATNTPTPSNTPTPTPTPTATNTPTSTLTPVAQAISPVLSLVVPTSGTLSNEARLNPGEGMSLTLFTPSTVEGTGSIEVSSDDGATWKTLQKDGTDVAVTASKAIPLEEIHGTRLRIKQGSAAASRVYTVAGTGR